MNRFIGSIFISHSSQDPDYLATKTLAEALEGTGFDVWWDKERLEGGAFFPVEILEAIIRQHFFVFIVSERSVASKWCRRELVKAAELEKDIKPLILEHVAKEESPIELAGLQYVEIGAGIADSLPSILRALGIGAASLRSIPDDPFARDGQLLKTIAEQLPYAKTFTDSPNLVEMLKNIGLKCSETGRAKELLRNMTSPSLCSSRLGMQCIDYDKVSAYLLREWYK
jgi:hypothetical protein